MVLDCSGARLHLPLALVHIFRYLSTVPAGEWMEPFTASLIGMNGWVIVLAGSLVNLVTNKVGAAAVDILFIACVFSVNTLCKGISTFCQVVSVSCWFWKEFCTLHSLWRGSCKNQYVLGSFVYSKFPAKQTFECLRLCV